MSGTIPTPRELKDMDNGSIADQGTHEELLARCAIYREVYEQQTNGNGGDE